MHIGAMYIHPVKSLAAMAREAFFIDRFGPTWDRRWMVVDARGRFITQRQCATMALIQTALDDDVLCLSHRDQETLRVSIAQCAHGEPVTVQVWDDECAARLAPPVVHQWLSDVLGRSCRLVYMPDSTHRPVDPDYAPGGATVSFADGFPLLLTTQASLADLNGEMSQSVAMQRFRPNLVVEDAAPWGEDHWRVIQVGAMVFDVVKPCSRCAIPTIDPATGEKQPEVFRVLQQYRRRGNQVFFGQNLVPRGTGTLRLGDRVRVLESA
ncbi:MAG: MOSC domain-containing protein [Pseudomonadales bacterium]|nr:MOSC domain-containing protein [Pseudomonadales bacterium]